MVFSYDGLGAGVTLIDFHIRRCHSIASGTGGIHKIGGATSFTMIRGSISGCSGRMVGGVVSMGFTSFIDVLINDCHAFGTEYEGISGTTVFIGGGGILIGTGTLTMSGVALSATAMLPTETVAESIGRQRCADGVERSDSAGLHSRIWRRHVS